MPDDTALVTNELGGTEKSSKVCANCAWWLRALVPPEQQDAWGQQTFNFGECRACPPTALSSNRKYESAGEAGQQKATVSIKQARFPHTYDNDWCGSWVPRNSGE